MNALLYLLLALVLPPCATEDAANCYWNDGTGAAFIDLDGTAYYLTERTAHAA